MKPIIITEKNRIKNKVLGAFFFALFPFVFIFSQTFSDNPDVFIKDKTCVTEIKTIDAPTFYIVSGTIVHGLNNISIVEPSSRSKIKENSGFVYKRTNQNVEKERIEEEKREQKLNLRKVVFEPLNSERNLSLIKYRTIIAVITNLLKQKNKVFFLAFLVRKEHKFLLKIGTEKRIKDFGNHDFKINALVNNIYIRPPPFV